MLRSLAEAYAARQPVTVAVVGNAPLEPSEERAALMDSCDLVFRVNGFRMDEPNGPPAVGSRTNVVVFNRALRATPWFFRDYRQRLYLMVEPGRLHWERPTRPAWWPDDLGAVTISNRDVVVPLASAMGIDARRDAVWATTGTTMAWLALAMFPETRVHLTGFSFVDRPEQTSWEHAYGDPSPVGPEHVIERESALMREWLRLGLAEFHR